MQQLAKSKNPLSSLYNQALLEASGEFKPIKLPWDNLNRAIGGGLLPGTISLLIGEPGSCKTYMALMACMFAGNNDFGWAYIPLERNKQYAERRLISILYEDWDIMDNEKASKLVKILENDEIRKNLYPLCGGIIENPRHERIDENGNIYIPEVHYDEMIESIRELCATKSLIVIDPLSMLSFDDGGKKQWEGQERFAKDVAALCSQYNARLLIVHHTRKSAPGLTARKNTLDESAGSAGLTRFADNVIFLEHYSDGMESEITDRMGVVREVSHKRVIYVAKARDGRGTGWRIACDMRDNGPVLFEHGLIRRKQSDGAKQKNIY